VGINFNKGLASIVLSASMIFSIPSFSQFNKISPKEKYREKYTYSLDSIFDNKDFNSKELEKNWPKLIFYNSLRLDSLKYVNLEKRLQKEKSLGKAVQNNKKDKHAVLITGYNEPRFQNDISQIYLILLNNGFKTDNIYILDELGTEKTLYPSDGVATKKSLEKLFSHLEKKVDNKDLFVVHISGHGGRELIIKKDLKQIDSITLANRYKDFVSRSLDWNDPLKVFENLFPEHSEFVTKIGVEGSDVELFFKGKQPYIDCPTDKDFERYISNIKPKIGIITNTLCYGGAVAQRLGKDNYIAISNSKENEVSYLIEGHSFGLYFYKSFLTDSVDTNKDKRVTINEAFETAKKSILNLPNDPLRQFMWNLLTKPTTPLLIYDNKKINLENISLKKYYSNK
jgi:hypothetical protein